MMYKWSLAVLFKGRLGYEEFTAMRPAFEVLQAAATVSHSHSRLEPQTF
jgi:hypothetical protein